MKIRTVFMAKIASKRKETRPLLSGKPTWRAKKLIIFYFKNEVLRPAQNARLSRRFTPGPKLAAVAQLAVTHQVRGSYTVQLYMCTVQIVVSRIL